jgi:ATP-dependent Zn protease
MARAKRQTMGYAFPKPTMDDLLASRERLIRTSVEFLKIDLATALIFAKIARESRDNIRKKRNLGAARKAYDTMQRLMGKVEMGDRDTQFLHQGLAQLKNELLELGETF